MQGDGRETQVNDRQGLGTEGKRLAWSGLAMEENRRQTIGIGLAQNCEVTTRSGIEW